jgi:hypothetical protein
LGVSQIALPVKIFEFEHVAALQVIVEGLTDEG